MMPEARWRARRTPRGAAPDGVRWKEILRAFAIELHGLRELLGLSQEQLARRAGISQGAISRLEGGRAYETPLLTYARVGAALCQELGPVRDALTLDVRAVVELLERALTFTRHRGPASVFEDPAFAEMLRLYGRLPARDRAALATVATWMVARLED